MENALNSEKGQKIDFVTVNNVLNLLRDVAEEDYALNLEKAGKAKTSEERIAAINALEASTKAAAQLSQAQEYFLHSRDSFRFSTTEMMRGNEQAAEHHASRSSEMMMKTAERVALFTDYSAKGSMFNAAIELVGRRDEIAANIANKTSDFKDAAHVKMARTSASFSRGIKAFAETMREFGTQIKNTPARIKEAVKSRAISMFDATVEVAGSMMSKVRAFGAKSAIAINERVEPVLHKAEQMGVSAKDQIHRVADGARDMRDIAVHTTKEKAQQYGATAKLATWLLIDDLSEQAKHAATVTKNVSVAAAEGVERHGVAAYAVAEAAVSVPVRGLGKVVDAATDVGVAAAQSLARLGASVVGTYGSKVAEVAEKQAKRRNQP